MADRKFYRTVIEVEVLSEEPLPDPEHLESVVYEITDGACSGSTKVTSITVVGGAETASLLAAQGSDPSFFRLDEKGGELERT